MIDVEPTMTPADVAGLTGLSYQGVLDEIHAGALRAKRIRRRYLITREAYDAWLRPDEPLWTPTAEAARPAGRGGSTRAPRAGTVAALKALEGGGRA